MASFWIAKKDTDETNANNKLLTGNPSNYSEIIPYIRCLFIPYQNVSHSIYFGNMISFLTVSPTFQPKWLPSFWGFSLHLWCFFHPKIWNFHAKPETPAVGDQTKAQGCRVLLGRHGNVQGATSLGGQCLDLCAEAQQRTSVTLVGLVRPHGTDGKIYRILSPEINGEIIYYIYLKIFHTWNIWVLYIKDSKWHVCFYNLYKGFQWIERIVFNKLQHVLFGVFVF